MQLAGADVWREVGEWWAGETPCEYIRTSNNGVRKTEVTQIVSQPALVKIEPTQEDYSEEISLQKQARRHRDTWSEYSNRGADLPFYESYKAKDARRHNSSTSVKLSSAKVSYVPLHVRTGFAFGQSLIHASDLPAFAAMRNCPAAAIADPFSLVGAVEFVKAARKIGVKPLVGASIELDCADCDAKVKVGGELVLIAKSKLGYRNLSSLISACHLEEPRQYPLCNWERLGCHHAHLICLTGGDGGPINQLLGFGDTSAAERVLDKMIKIFGKDNVYVEIERSFAPWQRRINDLLLELAERFRLTPVAGGIVAHESPAQFQAQDILVCSETLCLVDEIIGRKPRRCDGQPEVRQRPDRWLNGERYLRHSEEMAALYSDVPRLLENTIRLAEKCDDDVLPGRTRLPGVTEDDNAYLYAVAWDGARKRYKSIPNKLKSRIDHELNRIINLGYSGHFCTIYEACQWADSQQILYSGRGSVVDSVIAFCLGLSRIDAYSHQLHFDRFLPSDGSKRPDIDIDFEAHRRDDIRNFFKRRYGADRVATVAAIGTFGTRGIIREIGKAMGLSDSTLGQFAKLIHGGVSPERLEQCLDSRPELRDSGIPRERFRWIVELAPLIADIPRNIRAHSSGIVISSEPLCHTVPVMLSGVEDVQIIQWDKRSAKHYFDKFDVLCLRGQDVLSGTQRRIRTRHRDFNVEQISLTDEDTYRTMRSGQLIGIPQSASPAMRQAHVRLRTKNLHDASLVQAGIRPGVGGAVKLNELIARRRGKPYTYLHPDFEEILGHTYGIIVFQEQVDQLLQTFCGYTSGEAESIREAIHENRKSDYGKSIRDELLEKTLGNGHTIEVAEHVFDLVAGFKGYGFAQGHALAFAEISIRSIYCQQNCPADYFAALLDAQPAGYYGPCTLANEARARGVAILPPDINASRSTFEVEDVQSLQDPKLVLPNAGIRVSLNQISGISDCLRERTEKERLDGYRSMYDFVLRVLPDRDELERLILCGAFDSLHPNRRSLLWCIPRAFDYAHSAKAMQAGLQIPMPEPPLEDEVQDFLHHEKAIFERSILGMDVHQHLMAYERQRVAAKGAILSTEVEQLQHGDKAIVVGNPIRLRFPPTASGKRVVFFDLEDEAGLLNVTCFDDVYRRDGHAIVSSPYVTIRGVAQNRDGHMAFLAQRVFPYQPKLNSEGLVQIETLFETADFLAR